MKNKMNKTLPMKKSEWKRSGIQQNGASLMTSIGLIEGDVLNLIEKNGTISLKEIVQKTAWPEVMVLMSAGALIRDGLVLSKHQDRTVFLESKESRAKLDSMYEDFPIFRSYIQRSRR